MLTSLAFVKFGGERRDELVRTTTEVRGQLIRGERGELSRRTRLAWAMTSRWDDDDPEDEDMARKA